MTKEFQACYYAFTFPSLISTSSLQLLDSVAVNPRRLTVVRNAIIHKSQKGQQMAHNSNLGDFTLRV